MAQEILTNGETGLGIRNKINSNFTELYTGKADVSSLDAKMNVNITVDTPDLSAVSQYTLVLSDNNRLKRLSKATAIVLNIPTNASVAFPIGAQILISQAGAGQITITPAGGVTVNSANGLKTRAQHSQISLIQVAANTWLAGGDLTV